MNHLTGTGRQMKSKHGSRSPRANWGGNLGDAGVPAVVWGILVQRRRDVMVSPPLRTGLPQAPRVLCILVLFNQCRSSTLAVGPPVKEEPGNRFK